MFDGILQPWHLIVILFLCVLIFGPKKLPELGRGLGESIREFKKSMAEARAEGAEPVKPATADDVKK
jgi:sec-independent protein translocase protein TatA